MIYDSYDSYDYVTIMNYVLFFYMVCYKRIVFNFQCSVQCSLRVHCIFFGIQIQTYTQVS